MNKGITTCTMKMNGVRKWSCGEIDRRVWGTHHSLSETLHFDDYLDSHMYSASVVGSSTAKRRTLARAIRGETAETIARNNHERGKLFGST